MAMFCKKLLRPAIHRNNLLFKRNAYIVLLPEIPGDTAETNPLLRANILPPFSELTTDKCVNAVGKLIIEHESGIHHLDERLHDANIPKNVQNVILPLDKLSTPLDFAWGVLKILYTVNSQDRIADAYIKLLPRILKAKRERYRSPSIYRAFKELKVDEKQFTEPVQRIINKHILESKLSGIELSDNKKTHYNTTMVRLEKFKSNYRKKLGESNALFSHFLEMKDVQNFPKELLCRFAADPTNPTAGPWYVTLDSQVYKPFMEHCENRLLRWNTYQARNIRASSSVGRNLNNSIEIEEIRYCRLELANIFGYKSFADLSMETKMAGNVDNVLAMITTLRVKSKMDTLREIQDLQAYANENGFDSKLEMWDIPFWQRKYKEEHFRLDETVIRQYFPFPTVLRGLFNFCSKLFGISIVDATSSVDTWHEDVTFYKIYDENEKQIASFFMDPYLRPADKVQGAWMEVGKNRSDVCGAEPLSYLIFNFSPPQGGKPPLLSFEDVRNLLKKFGHLLQHSLTAIPYNDAAGLTNLEWDVVNVCPLFMSHWLTHYNTVASLSGHVDSGEVLPVQMHEKFLKGEQYMAGLRLTQEIYLAALDLELYSRSEFWGDVTKRIWTQYIPFPFEKKDAHPCSFSQIFCEEYPAAYFSFLWAEMIAADVFSAFQEIDLDNKDAVKQVGQRFRDTFLSLGGGCHPSEVFRRFRGRDPSTDALLVSYGLNKQSSLKPEEA